MTTRDLLLTREETPATPGAAVRFVRAKGTSGAMSAMNAWARARHRLGRGLRIRGLDHVTIPCRDLCVAENFYVGVLGGIRSTNRVPDAAVMLA